MVKTIENLGCCTCKRLKKEDYKMKITKRQLKKIIREEYSRLKRRGLIKEQYDQNRVDDMIMYLDDMMMHADRALGSYEMNDEKTMGGYQDSFDNMEDPAYIKSKLQAAFPKASMEEIEEAMASF